MLSMLGASMVTINPPPVAIAKEEAAKTLTNID